MLAITQDDTCLPKLRAATVEPVENNTSALLQMIVFNVGLTPSLPVALHFSLELFAPRELIAALLPCEQASSPRSDQHTSAHF